MTSYRVFLYVQHLLGIGHLQRAACLSRAMAEAGIDVTLASGGEPVADIDPGPVRFVQLPPLRAADNRFSALKTGDGRAVDDDFRHRRVAALLDAFHAAKPDILITEQFPFGRRQLRFELLPLLEAARAGAAHTGILQSKAFRSGSGPANGSANGGGRTAVVASVRDILVAPSRPERFDEMLDLVRTHYDLVLVHGDPAIVPFSDTFPHAAALGDTLVHTGYVRDAPSAAHGPDRSRPAQGEEASGHVLVAAGGGAAGERLFRAALAARPLSSLATAPWRILAGDRLAPAVFEDLRRAAPEGITVGRARPDYPALLAGCALSISQAGYNTVLDLLEARPRAVLVPVGDGQTEQAERARRLQGRAGFEIVEKGGSSDTAPDAAFVAALAAAVDRATAGPRIRDAGIDTGGAARTAEIVLDLWERRRAVADSLTR